MAEEKSISDELNELPELARLDSELSFVVDLAEGVSVPWTCRMKNNNLIVEVPLNLPQYGSRDRYVSYYIYNLINKAHCKPQKFLINLLLFNLVIKIWCVHDSLGSNSIFIILSMM